MTLTREQILEMPAGPELDALVAERVMGDPRNFLVRVRSCGKVYTIIGRKTLAEAQAYRGALEIVTAKKYSTDIAAAMEAAKKRDDWQFALEWNPWERRWEAQFIPTDRMPKVGLVGEAMATAVETAPLAICRAALLTTLKDKDSNE